MAAPAQPPNSSVERQRDLAREPRTSRIGVSCAGIARTSLCQEWSSVTTWRTEREHKLKKSQAIFGAVLIVGLTLFVATPPVNASNWWARGGWEGCTGMNQADDVNFYYFYSSLTSGMVTGVDFARTNHVNPTRVNTYNDGANRPGTDGVFLDEDYSMFCNFPWDDPVSGGYVGATICAKKNAIGECDKAEIRFDTGDTNTMSQIDRNNLALHEFGHALGLGHRDSEFGVMLTGYPYPSFFTSHDVSHLSALRS